MSFHVAADAYDRFMGRYSLQLTPLLADLAGVRAGQRALDVGCGPGALTAELVARLGADAVAAVDPSAPFAEAARERQPGIEVKLAAAEDLPFEDGVFDVALAQLVVHFMADPVAGLREMGRVTRSGGIVAASVWDHAGDKTPLAAFWQAVRALDPGARGESGLAGAHEGHLSELFTAAGLGEVKETALQISLDHETFEDWWDPFTLGVGPAGAYVAQLDPTDRAELLECCRQQLPEAPFTLSAQAWAARGLA